MQREIWFQKVAWSYISCHWKGFAVVAAIILPTLAAITLGQMVLDALGYSGLDELPFPIFLLSAVLFLMGIAKRHS